MDALVTAGGIPEEGEPLYEYTQGKPKALLEIAGKLMIQWVLDALSGSDRIDRIVVIGLDEIDAVHCEKIAAYVPNQGGLLENARAGMIKVLELNPNAKQVVVASSDIPAITSEMVDWMVDNAKGSDLDLHYHVVTREVMEKRYPESNRSYIRLKDLEVCGGDMNVVRAMAVTANEERLERIIDSRKSVFKQAALIGYGTLLLLLLGRLDVNGAIERVTKRMEITGKLVLSPYAEIAMDADKPHQLEILRTDMAEKMETLGT
jgi:NDP-sugar pyrophosphorylase family protein